MFAPTWGVPGSEAPDELLHFEPLGAAGPVGPGQGVLFGEAAGALQEAEAVFIAPLPDVGFPDVVEGPEEFHAGAACAVQLGHHGADFAGVEDAHQEGFDGIVEMMAQGDLVAAQGAGAAVQVAAAHAGAQVARRLFHVKHGIKNGCFEEGEGHVQQGGVVFEGPAVRGGVAGVHAQEDEPEGDLVAPLQLLEQLGQEHGGLAAGNAHGNLVARVDHVIVADGLDELVENLMLVFRAQGRLDVFEPPGVRYGCGSRRAVRGGGGRCFFFVCHDVLVLFQS